MEERTARRLMAVVRTAQIDEGVVFEMDALGVRVRYRWPAKDSTNVYTAEESVTWANVKKREVNPILEAYIRLRKLKEIQERVDEPG